MISGEIRLGDDSKCKCASVGFFCKCTSPFRSPETRPPDNREVVRHAQLQSCPCWKPALGNAHSEAGTLGGELFSRTERQNGVRYWQEQLHLLFGSCFAIFVQFPLQLEELT